MKSEFVKRVEVALKTYMPAKIDKVRIANARGILTAYEVAACNGLSEAGKVDCVKVCETYLHEPINYENKNEYHYTKYDWQGNEIKTVQAFNMQTAIVTICFEIKSSVTDLKSPFGHNFVGNCNYYVMPADLYDHIIKNGDIEKIPFNIGVIIAHEGRRGIWLMQKRPCFTNSDFTSNDNFMLAWSAVKAAYINKNKSSRNVNTAAMVNCPAFKIL